MFIAISQTGFFSVKRFYDGIKKLMESVNAPLRLSQTGIRNINIIVEEGFAPERMQNNPKLVTRESLMGILNKIA